MSTGEGERDPRDRRGFDRRLRGRDAEVFAAQLRARGVPDALIEGEDDLVGLSAEINVRGVERLTPREAAEAAGLDPDEARRVWTTAGLSVPGDDEPAFAPEEVTVLRFYAAAAEIFGAGAVLPALRVFGSAFNRIAEAEVAVLRLAYEVPLLEAGGSDDDLSDGYQRLGRMFLPEVEAVFPALHRLHLARASRRGWAVDDESSATLARVAVGFADLTGFTSLSGRLTPSELAGMVDAFDEHATELVQANGGQVVKLIGDEVMFVTDRLADGAAVARALARGLTTGPELGGVRVGVAAGEVVNRDGDYYGPVVNLAARLVTCAEPGEVLVDATLAALAPDDVEALVPIEVKGFDHPVEAFRLLG